MRVLTRDRKWRWVGVGMALAMWVGVSLAGAYSDRAEITPVHCLIPAIWALLISPPLCNFVVTDSRWFYPCWGLFCGLSMIGMFRFFLWSVGLHVTCDRVMYGGPLFVTVLVGAQGVLNQLKERFQSESMRSINPAAITDSESGRQQHVLPRASAH